MIHRLWKQNLTDNSFKKDVWWIVYYIFIGVLPAQKIINNEIKLQYKVHYMTYVYKYM